MAVMLFIVTIVTGRPAVVAGGPAETPVDPYWKTRSILNKKPGRSLIGRAPRARPPGPARTRARPRARAPARVRVCAPARPRVCACARVRSQAPGPARDGIRGP